MDSYRDYIIHILEGHIKSFKRQSHFVVDFDHHENVYYPTISSKRQQQQRQQQKPNLEKTRRI